MTDKDDETLSVKRLQVESGIFLLSNGDVQIRTSLVYPQYDVNWICLALESRAFDVFFPEAHLPPICPVAGAEIVTKCSQGGQGRNSVVVGCRDAVYQAAGLLNEASVPVNGVFEPVSVDDNLSSGGQRGQNESLLCELDASDFRSRRQGTDNGVKSSAEATRGNDGDVQERSRGAG